MTGTRRSPFLASGFVPGSAPRLWHVPRFGPRQIRAESSLLRRFNGSTGAAPFDSLCVADIGDVNVNPYSLPQSCRLIRGAFQDIMGSGCVPLTLGKDPRPPHVPAHDSSLPSLSVNAARGE